MQINVTRHIRNTVKSWLSDFAKLYVVAITVADYMMQYGIRGKNLLDYIIFDDYWTQQFNAWHTPFFHLRQSQGSQIWHNIANLIQIHRISSISFCHHPSISAIPFNLLLPSSFIPPMPQTTSYFNLTSRPNKYYPAVVIDNTAGQMNFWRHRRYLRRHRLHDSLRPTWTSLLMTSRNKVSPSNIRPFSGAALRSCNFFY